jgi:2-polyprenyl-3-methyl-5-hydroxy-6-metoxy-1,4-benzoquinol methylase
MQEDRILMTSTTKGLRGALESSEPRRRSFDAYRRFIQNHYDGLPGALTAVTGLLTGHEALAGRLIRPGAFDVRGCKRILDAACGNGRYSRFLLRHADADALITSFDLSPRMLLRARARLKNERVSHAVADLTCLPYADTSFDAVVCGWVLEHLPDPRLGLRELARVLQLGGKLLLLSTEDTLTGAMCSRLWHCRTYNRGELRHVCGECGLRWESEMWFSSMHRLLKLGGIIVELRRAE